MWLLSNETMEENRPEAYLVSDRWPKISRTQPPPPQKDPTLLDKAFHNSQDHKFEQARSRLQKLPTSKEHILINTHFECGREEKGAKENLLEGTRENRERRSSSSQRAEPGSNQRPPFTAPEQSLSLIYNF